MLNKKKALLHHFCHIFTICKMRGVLSRNLCHADPEGQRGRWFLVAKKGQEKDNNSRFYIHWSGLEKATAISSFLVAKKGQEKDNNLCFYIRRIVHADLKSQRGRRVAK